MIFIGIIIILLIAMAAAMFISSKVKRGLQASGNQSAGAIGIFTFVFCFVVIFCAIAFAIIYYTRFSWS
ncbi:hypothetical protein [Mucilaginibacter pedocola]|uniref:Uncharacterized protein n=1 Tax=Mucilaginibacter pedocola TaxID=1792845 RepID=A0A1S9PGT8_9SPHI|nr:hypothetical protein [Mucilaginibacter pedocola]OOQ60160.1 hypothetical protein BC343_26945 [Mucilaginibacter pedocola]